MLMVINMKGCGELIKDTDKELIGEMKQENWGESILVTGMKIKNMVEEHSSTKMETDMMDIGSMDSHREKEEWYIKMKIFMKDNGTKEREMDMEYWPKEMEIILKVIG